MTRFFEYLTNRKFAWLALLGCFTFAVPLFSFAYNGSLMRYNGDDYCYAASLAKYGFWKTQWYSYIHNMPYHGNRYSLTFFSSLSDLFGPTANAVLPALIILLWVVACWLVISAGSQIFHHGIHRLEALWLSEGFVFLTLYQAPSLAQSLYWRSGMLPYTGFLVFTIFLIALILREGVLQESAYSTIGLAFVLAIIAGGFSETGASLQAGYLILICGYLLYNFFTRRKWKQSLFRMFIAALVGTIIAVLLLVLSPAIQHLLVGPFTVYHLTSSIKGAVSDSWAFIHQSLKGLPIPNLVTFLVFAAVSFYLSSRDSGKNMPYYLYFFIGPLLAILSCFILIVFCMLPNELARTSYPDPRVLITARSVLVATVAVCGYLTGNGIAGIFNSTTLRKYMLVFIIVPMLILCIYPLYTTRAILSPTPLYLKWSSLWDTRHRVLQAAHQDGIKDINVMALDHIIPDVSDLSPDAGFWYNVCAASYYGLSSIKADQAGWDK